MLRTDSPANLGANPARRRYDDVRQLIASPENPTPIVRLNRVVPAGRYELFVKLEWYNPFGSIKDRPAYSMLREMERRGQLAGRELVEPTSGNTGIALAAIAALMGKKITVTIPDGVPEEKITMLRMLGAEVWAIVHVASQFADRHEGLAVAISPDSGFKYASYFTDLLGEEGLANA